MGADKLAIVSGALADGDIIDAKYRIVRFLGRGAWASVYEGVNVRIGRRVAIKVMSEEARQKPGIVERFEREAQAATRIDSEHVVHVFDLGVLHDGTPYIVMELLEGEDLAHQIRSHGALPPTRAVLYAVQALRGLADAHGAGVMHRDIKPDNIVLVRTKQGDEVVKIVDFGISKLHSGAQVTNMTQTNTVLGSPVYMSPEQCRGTKHMDHRSDLYSLGVVLFELLTGELPHKAETFNELMFKIALEDAMSPLTARPDLDPALADIVMKALARDVTERYQTALDFENALLEWGKGHNLDSATASSRRSRLRINVDDDPAVSLRKTTQRPKKLEGDDAGTSTGANERIESSVPRKLTPSTEQAKTLVEGGTHTADPVSTPTPPPMPPPTTSRVRLVGGAVAVVAAIGIVALIAGRKGDANAGAGASSALATSLPSAVPSVSAAMTPSAEREPSGAGTDVPPVASAAPSASSASAALPVLTGTPTSRGQPRRPTTPAAPASTPAVAVAPSVAAPTPPVTAPAPTGSTKSVIDGRRIRTDF